MADGFTMVKIREARLYLTQLPSFRVNISGDCFGRQERLRAFGTTRKRIEFPYGIHVNSN